MTYAEFVEGFEKEACSDWNKMDEHGECFGGVWQSENEFERANAFELSRINNMNKLWALPYPKPFLLFTVRIGCTVRQESVRDSNHFAVWLQRKRALM